MNPSFLLTRIFILFSAIFMASSASAQWANINSLPNTSFQEISFPSWRTGYAIVDSANSRNYGLYKTENAGVSWEQLALRLDSITNPHLQSVFFVNDQTGFLCLRGGIPQFDIFLLKTQDGGNSWADVTPDSLPVGYGDSDVFFTDLNKGFVASGGRLYRTADGGQNWALSLNMNWVGFNEIHFSDANFGIVGAWDGTFAYQGLIFTTSDGGLSWDSLIFNQTYTSIGNVFHAGNAAYAMTDHGWGEQKLFKTTDNGTTWDTLSLKFLADSSDTATDLIFISQSWGYITTAKGYIFVTEDGGQSWTFVHFERPELNFIAFNGRAFFVGGPINTLLIDNLPMAIDDPDAIATGFIYPNPCAKDGVLNFLEPLTGDFQIIDLNGKVIFQTSFVMQNSFDMHPLELTPGNYFVNLKGKKRLAAKLVLME